MDKVILRDIILWCMAGVCFIAMVVSTIWAIKTDMNSWRYK